MPNVLANRERLGGFTGVTGDVFVVAVAATVVAITTRGSGLDAVTGAGLAGWDLGCGFGAAGFAGGLGFTCGCGLVAGAGFVAFAVFALDESGVVGMGAGAVGMLKPMFAAITAASIGLAATIAPTGRPAAGAASELL